MSGISETEYAKARRRREEEEEEKRRQKQRKRRDNKVKRWTGKLGVIVISILIGMLIYNFLVGPVDANMNSTVVTGEGDFDKVVVNYEVVGDSTTKILLVVVEAPDEEFIATTDGWSFYDRSIDFFITVYIDGLAQPSEHFILRTKEFTTISCKNNITISFTFGVMNDVVAPFWEVNFFISTGVVVVSIVVISIFFILSWDRINYCWREKYY